jgi:hypothetical protein
MPNTGEPRELRPDTLSDALSDGGAQYWYYLSKDMALLPAQPAEFRFVTIEETNGVLTLSGGEPAVTIEETNGVFTLSGDEPVVTITSLTPGRLYSKNVRKQPGKYHTIEIIRINFEDGKDGFLEFAAAVNDPNTSTRSVDDRFQLLFDRDKQINYKGRTYTVSYEGTERPYLTYTYTYTYTVLAKGVKK